VVIVQEGDGAAGQRRDEAAVELMREISRREVPAVAEGGVGELLLAAAHRDRDGRRRMGNRERRTAALYRQCASKHQRALREGEKGRMREDSPGTSRRRRISLAPS
jgi:hypothetical protein